MPKFEDFTIEDTIQAWKVSAWNTEDESVPELEVTYHDLRRFTQEYYSMTRSEAINHLARCGEDQTELLLKELFKSKYK